jgi:hypothetical protein
VLSPELRRQVRQLEGKLLEQLCKIRKEENRSQSNHGRQISGTFFITSRNAAKLLLTIDQTLKNVVLTIDVFVKSTFVMSIGSMWDRAANIALVQILPKHSAGVAFIGHQSFWMQTNVTILSTNSTCSHQLFSARSCH